MQVKITLPQPYTVNDVAITEIVLTRAPTARDLGDYSFLSLIYEQSPPAVAAIGSKIAEPHLPVAAILDGDLANIGILTMGVQRFLDAAGEAKIEIIEAPTKGNSTKPTP